MLNNSKSLSMTLRVLYGSSNSGTETECLYLLQDTQFIALLPFVLKSTETQHAGRRQQPVLRLGEKESDAIVAGGISHRQLYRQGASLYFGASLVLSTFSTPAHMKRGRLSLLIYLHDDHIYLSVRTHVKPHGGHREAVRMRRLKLFSRYAGES